MANEEKKGITVKIDAALHAEVRQYLENHGMTMAEFITLAIDDELHPKIVEQEDKTMEKMRTLAFQVNEELFQKVKDYLRRNNMSQKEFVIGLIETEIDRDLAEREALKLQREAAEAGETNIAETEEATFDKEAEDSDLYSGDENRPMEEDAFTEENSEVGEATVEQPDYSDEMDEETAEENDLTESENAEEEEASVDEMINSEEETNVEEEISSDNEFESDEECERDDYLDPEDEEPEEDEEEEITMSM